MNRVDARRYAYTASLASVIISINDMSQRDNISTINPHIKDVLHLHFDDVDTGDYAMTDADALKITEFVNMWYTRIDIIVVHCHAGISRSSGVAAAILKYLTGDDSQIFSNCRYCPNMLCYRKVLNMFYKDK